MAPAPPWMMRRGVGIFWDGKGWEGKGREGEVGRRGGEEGRWVMDDGGVEIRGWEKIR